MDIRCYRLLLRAFNRRRYISNNDYEGLVELDFVKGFIFGFTVAMLMFMIF